MAEPSQNAFADAGGGTVSEEDAYRDLFARDPVLAGQARLWGGEANAATPTENAMAIAGMLPVIGNGIAAHDAYSNFGKLREASRTGDKREQRKAAVMTLLSALGVMAPLPVGRMAGRAAEGAASRTNIFAGPSAKTANHVALMRAQELEAQGTHPGEVWRATGWGRGEDGAWRFEIPDQNATVDFSHSPTYKTPEGDVKMARLDDVLDHPELYAAYPHLRRAQFQFHPDATPATSGGMAASYGWAPFENIKVFPGSRDGRSSTLHEAQHAVQRAEGFAPGSNPARHVRDMSGADRQAGEFEDAALLRRVADEHGVSVPQAAQYLERAMGRPPRGRAPEIAERHPVERIGAMQAKLEELRQRAANPSDAYMRSAGEVEARNVQTRRDFTDVERRIHPPRATADTSPQRQIIESPDSVGGGYEMEPRNAFATDRPPQLPPTTGNNSFAAFDAYHGSPHDFDEFKWNKDTIGTGEGAQAYGHGLYFAENPQVAKDYQRSLAGKGLPLRSIVEQHLGPDIPADEAGLAAIYNAAVHGKPDAKEAAKAVQARVPNFRDEGVSFMAPPGPKGEKLAAAIEKIRDAQRGRLYKAEIDAEPHHFLDWDKPLNQQDEGIRNAMLKLSRERGIKPEVDMPARQYEAEYIGPLVSAMPRPFNSRIYAEQALANRFDAIAAAEEIAPEKVPQIQAVLERYAARHEAASGEQWWKALNEANERDAAKASGALREAGIPGIRYLDQGSRGASGGTSNYVIFDDGIVKVKSKE